MAFLYPFGYGSTTLTIEQCETHRTIYLLHPEFWRRVKAMMFDAALNGVPLGVGTGWRIQAPNPGPGFASPGNSNHEGFPADGVSGGAVGADMVPTGSWPWMDKNAGRFGLRTFRFVGNEPWHIQPAEIPASRNWRTTPWTLARFPLPGVPFPPSEEPVTPAEIEATARRAATLVNESLPQANLTARTPAIGNGKTPLFDSWDLGNLFAFVKALSFMNVQLLSEGKTTAGDGSTVLPVFATSNQVDELAAKVDALTVAAQALFAALEGQKFKVEGEVGIIGPAE